MYSEIDSLARRAFPAAVSDRRHIHENPETGNCEKETQKYIASRLDEMGIEYTLGVGGGNSVVALIKGETEGKCIAIRADIDALPIKEETGLPFASKNEGVMHACGHDMHTAIALGTAFVLNGMRDVLPGCVKIIFQPAEEIQGYGAKQMIDDGVLTSPSVDAVIGLHVEPGKPVGSIALRPGAHCAGSAFFEINVKGRGGHGAVPHEAIDAIACSAQIITALQTIVSRNVNPLTPAVVTVGKIEGGRVVNQIAEDVYMGGTCRSFDTETLLGLGRRIEEISSSLASAFGASATVNFELNSPPIVNNGDMYALAMEVLPNIVGENIIIPENPGTVSDDFGELSDRVPGLMMGLGVLNPEGAFYPVHNARFNPDERGLFSGIKALSAIAIKYLSR